MQTLTERSTTQPKPARTLHEGEIRRFGPRKIPPVKAQLQQEWDAGKDPSRVTLPVTGLKVKITAGFSWIYKLLAGPPMSERDRLRYSAAVAQVQKHKAMAQQPTRGFF